MQDKLKQYVEDHREELELYQPRASLWEGVHERLRHGRGRTFRRFLAIAAALLLLVGGGAYVFFKGPPAPAGEPVMAVQPAIMQTEAYLTAVVQAKDAQLDQYCTPQPALCREFARDMGTLSTAYEQLKKEYATAADKKAVLQAMTANLLMQVQLINRQLQIMEAVEQKEAEVNII